MELRLTVRSWALGLFFGAVLFYLPNLTPVLLFLALGLLAKTNRKIGWPPKVFGGSILLPVALVLVTVWAACSTVWAVEPFASITRLIKIATILAGVAVCLFCMNRTADRAFLNWDTVYMAMVLLLIGLILTEKSTGVPSLVAEQVASVDRVNFLNEPATLMTLLIFPALLIAGRFHGKGAALLLALAAGTAIACAASIAPLAAFAVGLIVFVAAMLSIRGVLSILSLGTIAFSVVLPITLAMVNIAEFATNDLGEIQPSVTHRFFIWDFTVDRIAERPWLGWGLDASRMIPGGNVTVAEYAAESGMALEMGPFISSAEILPLHPHNIFLQALLELGVVGLTLLLTLLVATLWRSAVLPFGLAPPALAVNTAWLTVSAMSFGLWQSWWLGAAGLMVILIAALSSARAFHSVGSEKA